MAFFDIFFEILISYVYSVGAVEGHQFGLKLRDVQQDIESAFLISKSKSNLMSVGSP